METQQQSTQLKDFLREVAWKLKTEWWTVIYREKKRTLVKDGKIHQNGSKRGFKIKTYAHEGREKFQNLKSRMKIWKADWQTENNLAEWRGWTSKLQREKSKSKVMDPAIPRSLLSPWPWYLGKQEWRLLYKCIDSNSVKKGLDHLLLSAQSSTCLSPTLASPWRFLFPGGWLKHTSQTRERTPYYNHGSHWMWRAPALSNNLAS